MTNVSISESFGSIRQTPPMPGTPVGPYPKVWERGPNILAGQTWTAKAADGMLRVIVSRDPAGKHSSYLWHCSMRFVDHDDRPTRCPTWDELKAMRYTFMPDDVCMALIFPRRSVRYVDEYPTAIHLWETEEPIDQ